MKKEIMEKWVSALRSGNYSQGTRRLKTFNNEFCCLGVLCDISSLGQWDIDQDYLGKTGILPKEVQEWAGLNDCAGIAYRDDNLYQETIHLTNFNDKGYSFNSLADIIEKNWEIL